MGEPSEKRSREWLREVQGVDPGETGLTDAAAALANARDAVRELAAALPFEAEPSAFLKALDDLAPRPADDE